MNAPLAVAGACAGMLGMQAAVVRRRVPRLPDAAGVREGYVSGPRPTLAVQVLGESSVAGVGIERIEDSLAPALARGLAARCDRGVLWVAHGWSGARVVGLEQRLLPRVTAPLDLLVVIVGVNDVLRLTRPGVWECGVERLFRSIRRQLGDVAVAWVGLPQLGAFHGLPQPLRAIAGARAETMDRLAARVVRRQRAAWFIPTPAGEPALVGADGFHPNEEGYRQWANHIADACCQRLSLPAPAANQAPGLSPVTPAPATARPAALPV